MSVIEITALRLEGMVDIYLEARGKVFSESSTVKIAKAIKKRKSAVRRVAFEFKKKGF